MKNRHSLAAAERERERERERKRERLYLCGFKRVKHFSRTVPDTHTAQLLALNRRRCHTGQRELEFTLCSMNKAQDERSQ